jgi:hypothetical protein
VVESAVDTPFYSDDDKQFFARPVRDEDMIAWEKSATESIKRMIPGGVNWPMIVRSLIAEVRKLRHEQEAEDASGSPSSDLKDHLVCKIDRALHDAENSDMPAQAKELVSQAHADLHDLAGLLSDDAEIRASALASLSDQPQHQGDGR